MGQLCLTSCVVPLWRDAFKPRSGRLVGVAGCVAACALRAAIHPKPPSRQPPVKSYARWSKRERVRVCAAPHPSPSGLPGVCGSKRVGWRRAGVCASCSKLAWSVGSAVECKRASGVWRLAGRQCSACSGRSEYRQPAAARRVLLLQPLCFWQAIVAAAFPVATHWMLVAPLWLLKPSASGLGWVLCTDSFGMLLLAGCLHSYAPACMPCACARPSASCGTALHPSTGATRPPWRSRGRFTLRVNPPLCCLSPSARCAAGRLRAMPLVFPSLLRRPRAQRRSLDSKPQGRWVAASISCDCGCRAHCFCACGLLLHRAGLHVRSPLFSVAPGIHTQAPFHRDK